MINIYISLYKPSKKLRTRSVSDTALVVSHDPSFRRDRRRVSFDSIQPSSHFRAVFSRTSPKRASCSSTCATLKLLNDDDGGENNVLTLQ